MPLYDYECRKCQTTFEHFATSEDRTTRCKCRGVADRVWLSRGERRFLEHPILLDRLPDGSFSVPGGSDSKVAPGGERIEIRSMAQYDRVMREWNSHERGKAERHFDKVQEAREAVVASGRARLAEMMARESDPYRKDLLRAALDERPTAARELPFRPFMNEAMEMDASNRDAYWNKETSSGRGRK